MPNKCNPDIFLMTQVKLDTGFNIEVDFTITPFHKRFFAWVIDRLVIIAYFVIMYLIFEKGITKGGSTVQVILLLLGLPALLYHLLCEILMNGQSVGKRAMGIKVISADGGQPTISQYLIRWTFRLIDFPIWLLPAISENLLAWWCAPLLFAGLACLIA